MMGKNGWIWLCKISHLEKFWKASIYLTYLYIVAGAAVHPDHLTGSTEEEY
jgi:hypothetical protein